MTYPGEALLIKMWESLVDKGIGGFLRPRQIREEGRAATDALVEEKLRLAQAEQQAQAILRGEANLIGNTIVMLPSPDSIAVLPPSNPQTVLDASITKKITCASTADTIRKEINVAKAILEAEAELENDPSPPPEQPVNNDWLYRWRDYASEVSSEELQSMWGKILAGETKTPGSFSLRTMEFLRNVSQEEAQSIGKLAPYVIVNMIYRDQSYLDKVGISFKLLLSMQEMGIISGVEALGLQVTYNSLYSDRYINVVGRRNIKEKILIFEHHDASKIASIPAFVVTTIGQQIMGLCRSNIDEDYLRILASHLIRSDFKVKIATVRDIVGGVTHFHEEEKLEIINA